MGARGVNLSAITHTAIRILTSPSIFFREMPKTGGFREPLIFMVSMGFIGGLIQTVFSIIGGVGFPSLAILPITPLILLILGFVGAALFFVIWKIIGSVESYETAYRCTAYISALTPFIAILAMVPYVGVAGCFFTMAAFLVIASVVVHNIPRRNAWLVFGFLAAIATIYVVAGQIADRRFSREAVKFQKQMEEATKTMQKQ